ncbi:DUF4307 domain-containing protein [Rothia sp. P7181]|uniref:DUF4307 domain-containing protein n=1 Tax=unclassified Rothia (in: high G+C Gram-positive bacteria) TaxID=2689056 RepID=UPI003AE29878
MTTSLDSRYGRKPAQRNIPTWVWVLLAGCATIISMLFAWWVQSDSSATSPQARDLSHQLTSSDEVSLTFEVLKDPQVKAVCAVKALNSSRAPVGWKEVTIPADTAGESSSRVHVQTVNIRVLSPAVTATVDTCWSMRTSS